MLNVSVEQLEHILNILYGRQPTSTYIFAIYFHNKTKTSNNIPLYSVYSCGVVLSFLTPLQYALLGIIEHKSVH